MSDLFEHAAAVEAVFSVLTPAPIERALDYLAPAETPIGAFVEVPLGGRSISGVVWGPGSGDFARDKLKRIERVLDLPPMRSEMREFLSRAAEYTITDPGMMTRLATRAPGLADPPGARKIWRLGEGRPDRMTDARRRVLAVMEEYPGLGFAPSDLCTLAGVSAGVLNGLAEAGALIAAEAPRDAPYAPLDPDANPVTLTDAQAAAAEELCRSVAGRAYSAILLKGVTGSGKTEVYLEAVAECLRQGRQALILLPEIALTATFLKRVEQRFGARPAEWHSAITGAERRRAWRAVSAGNAQVVVGARSALFLPFTDLGLIVVDEEHDTSYKQEDGVRYHARDMAVLRASIEGGVAMLASATPSLESWANVDAGKYARLDLPERFGGAVLPTISAIDLRVAPPEPGQWLSRPVVDAVAERVARGEQAMLFLNRRGYAPLTLCRGCGHRFGCPDCDAWLVEHRFRRQMLCHQCGHSEAAPSKCPSCGAEDRLAACGPGVERLAEEAAARFPDARLAILSSDLAASAAEQKARIDAIAAGEADIVVGTQIVAKGHNFPLLTFVGVVDADLGLQGGDMRAAERTFQLMRQVAGRAGRADKPGSAMLQTAAPDHPVMRAIVSGDEEAFFLREAEARRAAGAPPYGRMIGVVVSGRDETRVWATAVELGRAGDRLRAAGCQLLGPAPAPIARVRGLSRARLLIKAPKGAPVQSAARSWREAVKIPSGIRVILDVDPQSFL